MRFCCWRINLTLDDLCDGIVGEEVFDLVRSLAKICGTYVVYGRNK